MQLHYSLTMTSVCDQALVQDPISPIVSSVDMELEPLCRTQAILKSPQHDRDKKLVSVDSVKHMHRDKILVSAEGLHRQKSCLRDIFLVSVEPRMFWVGE